MLNHTADIFTNTPKEIFIGIIWDKALNIGHSFCVPKHGSYYWCFIIFDTCIHQKFSTLKNPGKTEGKLDCRVKTDSTFQLDAGSLCSKAAMVSSMFRGMIKSTFYTNISTSIDDKVYSSHHSNKCFK